MTFVVPCEYPAPWSARANELVETWLLAVLVMCTDDPDQDEELEPPFMANLPALRDENRRNWRGGKVYTLPHSVSNGSCHIPLAGKGVIIGTHVSVRREDRETDCDLGVGVDIVLHDDIPDSSASGNHLDLMFPHAAATNRPRSASDPKRATAAVAEGSSCRDVGA